MIWTDAKGCKRELSRETARRLDREQGRKHCPHNVIESMIALAAAKNVIRAHRDTIKQWAQESKGWKYMAPVLSLMDLAIEKMAEHMNV